MRQDLYRIKHHIFKFPYASVSHKLTLVKAYLLSKGCYHASTWPVLTKTCFTKYHKAIMDTYREITLEVFDAETNPEPLNDQEIIRKYNLVNPSVLLSLARLQLFARIFKKDVQALVELIRFHQPKGTSWMAALRDDFKWFSSHESYQDKHDFTINQWINEVRSDPKQFISTVRKYSSTPYANLHAFRASDVPDVVTVAAPVVIIPCHRCHLCDHLPFATHQQVMLHLFVEHQVKNLVHSRVTTTFCEICLLQFHTRTRLIEHIKGHKGRGTICLNNYFDIPPVYDAIQLAEIDAVEATKNRALSAAAHRMHYAQFPVYSLPGPFRVVKYITRPCRHMGTGLPCRHHPLGIGYQYRN